VTFRRAGKSHNTTLTNRRIRSSVSGDAYDREVDPCNNPARLSLRPDT